MRVTKCITLCALFTASHGCGVDLEVPLDAQIECDSGAACPKDYTCLIEIHRCVRGEALGTVPRVVPGTVHLTRTVVTRNLAVGISFDVDTPLSDPPRVSLAWGGGSPGRRAAQLTSAEGNHFAFEYLVGQEESEGFADLAISLLSSESVPNELLQPRALQLDFSPPVLLPGTQQRVLHAPAGSRRQDVKAATIGTRVEVFFAVNELLAAGIEVDDNQDHDAPDSPTITFACDDPLGTFYRCEVVIDDSISNLREDEYVVWAHAEDLAGNDSGLRLATFTVDTTPPTAPDTMTPERVVVERWPYGNAESPGAARLLLTGVADAVQREAEERDLLVLVWDRHDTANGVEIARVAARGDGSIGPEQLPGVDRVAVYLNVIDAAGQESDVVPVLDGSWTATTGGKERGRTLPNPSVFKETSFWRKSRLSPMQREPTEPDRQATCGDAPLVTTPEPRFAPAPIFVGQPSVRGGCQLTYDPDSSRAILFGGYWLVYNVGTLFASDTWIWNGFSWREASPFVRPPPRAGHSLAFDRVRANTVLFGGYAGTELLGDTWTLEGESWRRVCWPGCAHPLECSCEAMPSPRQGHAMFWDSVRGQIIVFGGDDGEVRGDAWAWDGQTWSPVDWAPGPSPRAFALAATNPADGVTLLVSGRDSGGVALNETWVWSGSGWSGLAPPTYNPSYAGHALWFDSQSGKFLGYLFAGSRTFEWTGEDWAVSVPTVVGDSATLLNSRTAGCGAYDEERDFYLRFGGCVDSGCRTDSSAQNQSWSFSAATLRQLIPGQQPSPRSDAGMAYFPTTETGVLFGGRDDDRYERQDTWHWDGRNWTGDGAGNGTEGRHDFAMAYLGSDRLVRFGGEGYGMGSLWPATYYYSGSSWAKWAGSSYSYYVEPVPYNSSPDRMYQAMAYDPLNDEAIFFRGTTNGVKTWGGKWVSYNAAWYTHGETAGVLWTSKSPANEPSARDGHRLAYCPSSGGVVLFGGRVGAADYPQDTWVWSGTDWSDVTPLTSPPGRESHVMFCDQRRDRIYVFGGKNGSGLLDDVWEWDGASWTERFPVERPSARSGAVAAYNEALGEGVVFGGHNLEHLGDTWIWDGAQQARSAQVFSAVFDAAGVWDDCVLKDVESVWIAGGLGYVEGQATSGAALYVWDRGQWRATGADNAAGTGAVAELSWSTATDVEWSGYPSPARALYLKRLFVGSARELSFAVAPRGVSEDQSDTAVSSDYVQTTVRYRLTCRPAGRPSNEAGRCCTAQALDGVCL